MSDQHEIIDLGAAPDARLTHRGTVHARVGLDFDVVFNDCDSRLLHFVPAAVGLLGEPEAVAAHDSAVLQGHAMAHFTTLAHHCVRVGEEVVTDARVAIDDHKAMQHSVLPDLHALVHEAVRSNVCPRPDPSRSGHHRRGMYAGGIARSEEHTSELQSLAYLVCRLLLEKKKKTKEI